MVILAVIALVGGVVYGLSGLEVPLLTLLTDHSDLVLYLLMFLVGISIGMTRVSGPRSSSTTSKPFSFPSASFWAR